jgi:hypothetical protein
MTRTFLASLLLASALLAAAIAPGTATAEDLMSGMTPVGSAALGAANVQGNFFNTSEASATATSTGNSVSAKSGAQVVNGAIQNNAVTGNSGISAVLMNTGNNVNFNNAMIVNVILR